MKYITEYLHCGDILLKSFEAEIQELSSTIEAHPWSENFSFQTDTSTLQHQSAYNKSFAVLLSEKKWHLQPRLSDSPRLIGDFAKGLVFGEVQFGNSATLYRDFYKFQYGLQNGLLSLAVLVVPHDEYAFFPNRFGSVRNMANFGLAVRYFTMLPISLQLYTVCWPMMKKPLTIAAGETINSAPEQHAGTDQTWPGSSEADFPERQRVHQSRDNIFEPDPRRVFPAGFV